MADTAEAASTIRDFRVDAGGGWSIVVESDDTILATICAAQLWGRLSALGLEAPPQIYQALLRAAARLGEHCFYCGIEVTEGIEAGDPKAIASRRAVWDHIVPRCQGGADEPANLVLACTECNQRKGGRTPQEWKRAKGE